MKANIYQRYFQLISILLFCSCAPPKQMSQQQLQEVIEATRLQPDEAIISSKVLELSKMGTHYQIKSLFQKTYRTSFGFNTYLKFQDTLFITSTKPIKRISKGKYLIGVLQQTLTINSDKAHFILKEIFY